MQLFVCAGKVIIDAQREQALRDFAGGARLPPPEHRDIDTMLEWFEQAISRLDPDSEKDAARYAGLVLDKQYLRLVSKGLISPTPEK